MKNIMAIKRDSTFWRKIEFDNVILDVSTLW